MNRLSKEMDHIISQYQDAFKTNGDSPSAVLWPKGRQDERFNALTKYINSSKPFSILDYGCGLAHLNEYLKKHFSNYKYAGLDIVPEFVEFNRKKYPAAQFLLNDENLQNYDYIVSSGAFNILYKPTYPEHRDAVFAILEKLFSKANIYLSVNFMTDQVDFKYPEAYHQNIEELHHFVSARLSKRLIIDQSYMPYEYTVTIFKDQDILRPENIYRSV